MALKPDKKDILFLGIDGGGSKCKVVLTDSNMNILGEGIAGPANPVRGIDVATNSIMEATSQALKVAGLGNEDFSRLHVGAGLAELS